jgi:hypothetical protein
MLATRTHIYTISKIYLVNFLSHFLNYIHFCFIVWYENIKIIKKYSKNQIKAYSLQYNLKRSALYHQSNKQLSHEMWKEGV